MIPFSEIEEPLHSLLERYGPPRKIYHPEPPFWHLQSDGLWELEHTDKPIKIGAKVVRHAGYVMFQMAEVAIPRNLFARILTRIQGLGLPVPRPT